MPVNVVATVQKGSSRKDVHMLFPEEEKIIVENPGPTNTLLTQPFWSAGQKYNKYSGPL